MDRQSDVEALLAKANQPSTDALRLHPWYRGKLEVTPKCAIRGLEDFAIWYTPGGAVPCREIAQHPDAVSSLLTRAISHVVYPRGKHTAAHRQAVGANKNAEG